jgi:ligand-binding sensor domain-containing protein
MNRDGFSYYGFTEDVKDMELFAGHQYAATAGGLVVLDDRGRVTARYTTLDGLPSNDLTALTTFKEQLYIGTVHGGLLSYDGRAFTQYRFLQPKAHYVTSLMAEDNRLFVGTFDNGLFEYDGHQFRHILSSGSPQVTSIFTRHPEIYVGTFAQGLFVWRDGRWSQFTKKDGLPSDRITAVLEHEDRILVSTDMGVVQIVQSVITPFAPISNIATLVRFREKIYAGLVTGQVVQLPESSGRPIPQVPLSPFMLPDNAANSALVDGVDRLWMCTSRGIYYTLSPGMEPVKRFDQTTAGFQLSAAHISALAMDWRGRLWIGYFDRGMDIVAPNEPKRIAHIEDSMIREINDIDPDENTRRMLIATSRGLVAIDESMRRQSYTEADGLISNSVSHVLPIPADLIFPRPDERPAQESALVVTTGKGLSVYADNVCRSLNAFHGLASNHLYTSARVGDKVFIGSLNGLNELEGLRVVRTFQTSNSKLSHNWVSALAVAGNTLYIGTYGGGVDAILPSGEMIGFANLIGTFSVNPNAMHVSGDRLYVGTLEQGVWILDIQNNRWSHVSQGLGSANVTAIAGDANALYVGTDHGLTRINTQTVTP